MCSCRPACNLNFASVKSLNQWECRDSSKNDSMSALLVGLPGLEKFIANLFA